MEKEKDKKVPQIEIVDKPVAAESSIGKEKVLEWTGQVKQGKMPDSDKTYLIITMDNPFANVDFGDIRLQFVAPGHSQEGLSKSDVSGQKNKGRFEFITKPLFTSEDTVVNITGTVQYIESRIGYNWRQYVQIEMDNVSEEMNEGRPFKVYITKGEIAGVFEDLAKAKLELTRVNKK